MNESIESEDLVIIGAGIMGLMTAYYASQFVKKVVLLEKSSFASREAASFSFTRSIRVDYLEPFYAQWAYEAQLLWRELQKKSPEPFLITCGCLNIVKKSITPDVDVTYAMKSYQTLSSLHYQPERIDGSAFKKRYPQFAADFGVLDTKGGYLYLPAITALLEKLLKQNGVKLITQTEILAIEDLPSGVRIKTSLGAFNSRKLVITAGKGTNDVLAKIKDNRLTLPLTYSRPERRYYYPPQKTFDLFMPESFPVFAYTDIGIYGHPIFDREKGAVKIAYFEPVGMKKSDRTIDSVETFVQTCIPMLRDVRSESITDADLCWYDIVADDEFILGELPEMHNIIMGTGWRGTGYKFATLIGKILAEWSVQGGTIYNVTKFKPGRFI